MLLSRPLLAVALLLGLANAQTIVIPDGAAAAEGESASLFPWGRGADSLRQQFVYDSANFTAQGVTTPILITRLRWRPDTNYTAAPQSWSACSYGRANIQLSTCPRDQSVASTTFAANRGDDATMVYSGPVGLPAGTATRPGPAPFLVDIPLTTPFVYDPAAGDLTIETDLPAGQFAGTPGLLLDHRYNVFGVDCRTSMVAATSDSTPTGSFTPGLGLVVEVSFTPVAGLAFTSRFGSGCMQPTAPADFASFYEFFPNSGAFDLSNTAFSMTPNGGGYTVAASTIAFRQPTAAATVLAFPTNPFATVTLASPFPVAGGAITQLDVCARGFVAVAPWGGTLPVGGSPGAVLGAPSTAWYVWHLFDPSRQGSGQVKFEEIGALSVLTWDGVLADPFNPFRSTFQFQFDRATGAVHYVFGTVNMLTVYGGSAIVGYSPGGASGDPGNRDLSATLSTPFPVRDADVAPLDFTSSARPRIGSATNLLTQALPATTVFGADALSFTRFVPGLDLGGLGMPGCRRHVGLDAVLVFLPAGGTGSLSLAVPANPVLAGVDVWSQSFAFAPGVNACGVTTSNGLRLHLDRN